jgi:hypothetical protein
MVIQNSGTKFFNQEKLRRGGPHNNASNEEHNAEYVTIAGIVTELGRSACVTCQNVAKQPVRLG